MNQIQVTITVDEFDHFLSVFQTRGLALRERHGSGGVQVMRHADDAERVCLLFDWDAERFAGFLADPEVKASMQASGTLGPPAIQHLEPVIQLAA